jgi:hypothetical protein
MIVEWSSGYDRGYITASRLRRLGDWRSWLARLHDMQEVTGSSPVSPICFRGPIGPCLGGGGIREFPRQKQKHAAVAQLVEQRFCKPQVVGSSPTGGFFFSNESRSGLMVPRLAVLGAVVRLVRC